MLLNVLDFASPAAAIAASFDGDIIYFPSRTPYTAPAGGWIIRKSLEIKGDGPGLVGQVSGTVLKAFNANDPVISIEGPVANVYIHDLQLQRGGTGAGTSVGIVCRSTTANKRVADLRLRGLLIAGMPSHGIHIEGFDTSTSKVERVYIAETEVRSCGGAGLRLVNAFDVHVSAVLCESNQGHGLTAIGGSVALYQCSFSDNGAMLSNAADGALQFTDCEMIRVDGCRVENFAQPVIKRGCVISATSSSQSGTAILGWCNFENATYDSASESIRVTGSFQGPAAILGNRHFGVGYLVRIDAGIRNAVVYPQHDEGQSGAMDIPAANGTYGVPLAAPATFSAGLMVPSVAANPTTRLRAGMLVYRANALWCYDGTNWRSIQAP